MKPQFSTIASRVHFVARDRVVEDEADDPIVRSRARA